MRCLLFVGIYTLGLTGPLLAVDAEIVSLQQLNERPSQYDGKTIKVRAAIHGKGVKGQGPWTRLTVTDESATIDGTIMHATGINIVINKGQEDQLLQGLEDGVKPVSMTLNVRRQGPKTPHWLGVVTDIKQTSSLIIDSPPKGGRVNGPNINRIDDIPTIDLGGGGSNVSPNGVSTLTSYFLLGGVAITGAGLLTFFIFSKGAEKAKPVGCDGILLLKKLVASLATDRIATLKQSLADHEQASTETLAEYQPNNPTSIDDLSKPVDQLLQAVPGVAHIENKVKVDSPTGRIVHLLDWKLVPKLQYGSELRSVAAKELSDQEIDQLYEEHLLEVEIVQLEQVAVLRALIRHHGLKTVFIEGLTPLGVDDFRRSAAILQQMNQANLGLMKDQLMRANGSKTADSANYARAVEEQVTQMLFEQRTRCLELGAAGVLLASGELAAVHPLDDILHVEPARAIARERQVGGDASKINIRGEHQVRKVLKSHPFGLVILNTASDLSEAVRRCGSKRCEYIQVATQSIREFSE